MPGSFPGGVSDGLLSGLDGGMHLNPDASLEEEKMRKLSLTRAQMNFEKDCLRQMHLFVLLELMVVYFADVSFLKLTIKAMLEYFLYHYDPIEHRQLLAIIMDNSAVPEDTRMSLEHQMALWKKILFSQLIFINFLAIMDHIYNYEGATLPLLHITRPINFYGFLDDIGKWINAESSYRLENYVDGRQNFSYGSVFIDFIGEMSKYFKSGLILLDLTIVLFQYVMFMIATTQEKRRDEEVTERSRLVDEFEDGYQGTVKAFSVDVYPRMSVGVMMVEVTS
ncbi:DEKNAAC105335 [Brettanomyces naardenensis]|uniref:DEKNAAC105335 n=1 Tax=Brettanomyces naardenensis TaxID=13370 RepID=A0A448YT93_BRENA|nr:DEKNAAC105335 [Brettanomyces naardenensis]